MKTLKLNNIEQNHLTEKEMIHVLGGRIDGMCGCGCAYENNGGSSAMNNGLANAKTGAWTGDKYICIQTVIVTPGGGIDGGLINPGGGLNGGF